MVLEDVGYDSVDWIAVAEDAVYCRAFVIMAMILQVLLRAVNFLTS
jgi:hypothetical protein